MAENGKTLAHGGDSSTGDGLLSPEMVIKVLRWRAS